ncbi:MAG: hypothetical protein EOO46_08280 [Flavobacterium sp.]|nr:MAG: hypothetical protein EOO46_08280 [Flavobacterium sp.]
MKTTIIFFIGILILSCNSASTKTRENSEFSKSEFKLSESNFVILDYDKRWYWLFKDGVPSNLNKNELDEIEGILNLAVKENNDREKLRLEKLNKESPTDKRTKTGHEITLEGKKRQYISILNRKGEKEIWVNFFCDDDENDNWKKFPKEVSDGGNCYFQVKVNLSIKTYYELRVNGYA